MEPEAATGITEKALVTANRHMVAAANPYAVEAGLEMLRAGGSAADAAIAVQLVLGLVEPQSSGIGGGAFVVHYNAKTHAVTTLDGRETAPLTARSDRFLENGQPIEFRKAVASGTGTGTPGVVQLLADMHRRHGTLPWQRLFEPAIRLARDGFIVSERLHRLLGWVGADRLSPTARDYFFTAGGAPVAVGSTLVNRPYAATLIAIADQGADVFYRGAIGAAMVEAITNDSRGAGDVAAADLAAYRVIERPAVCIRYRRYRVCGMGPPSSGGIIVAQVLKLIEPFSIGPPVDLAAGMAGDPTDSFAIVPAATLPTASMHLIAEAERLAYADRDQYVADPDFVALPDGLLDADYVDARRALIDPQRAMAKPQAGVPKGVGEAVGTDGTVERGGTSHISIVDGNGDAVSMTTTIESAFGSGLMVAGFLLNNQMTDFSFRSQDAGGRPIANRIEPGKRPRSSMAPTIILDEHGRDLFAVLGSPGGSKIPFYVIKAVVALLDLGQDAKAAAAMANFGARGATLELEAGSAALGAAPQLQRLGHQVVLGDLNSGAHIITRRDGVLQGSADPRREGIAAGD